MVVLKKFILLTALALLTGCASNDSYRSDYTLCHVSSGSQCQRHSLQKHNIEKNTRLTNWAR